MIIQTSRNLFFLLCVVYLIKEVGRFIKDNVFPFLDLSNFYFQGNPFVTITF